MANNPGNRATATGFAVMLLAVSAGVGSGESGLLLGLVGVLIGANVIAVGVRGMGEEPATPTAPLAFARRPGALLTASSLRRNLAFVGLMMASSAATAVAAEAGRMLCSGMFALLLLGLCLITVGVVGHYGGTYLDS